MMMMKEEALAVEELERVYGRPHMDPELRLWCRLHGWRFIGRDVEQRPTFQRGDLVAKAFVWEDASQIRNYLMAWMKVLKKS